MAVGEFDVEPHARAHGRGGTHGPTVLGPHQRKPPHQHAVIGQRGKELTGTIEPRLAAVDQGHHRPCGAGAQRIDPFAAARDAHALGLRIGTQAG